MKLSPADLMSLETYARERAAFRQRVIAHRRRRQVQVGPEVTLSFEDRLTVQYQVQEMLRIERIFEPTGIAEELAAYNPLIPDGGNLKATLLIEIPDPEVRRIRLGLLKGLERQCQLGVGGESVVAIADEDLDRENEEKTSAVHFLRFELTPDMQSALRAGASLELGFAHPAYSHRVSVAAETLAALRADLA